MLASLNIRCNHARENFLLGCAQGQVFLKAHFPERPTHRRTVQGIPGCLSCGGAVCSRPFVPMAQPARTYLQRLSKADQRLAGRLNSLPALIIADCALREATGECQVLLCPSKTQPHFPHSIAEGIHSSSSFPFADRRIRCRQAISILISILAN